MPDEIVFARRELGAWIAARVSGYEDDAWSGHCLRHWLFELGGMAGAW